MMAKVSKLHTSFFKTFYEKELTSLSLIFVKGNTSRFGSAVASATGIIYTLTWRII